jgi:hypothetical protein
MIYLYCKVYLTLRIKKNDDKRPANIADSTIKAAVLPDYKKPIAARVWSKFAKYEVIVP